MRIRMTLAWRATLSIHRSTDIGWRRSRSAASRIEGKRAASAFHATARPARSLSVKDRAKISAGVCRRSTGSARSSSEAELVVSMCISPLGRLASAGEYSLDRRAVQPLEADDDEPRAAVVLGGPGAVIVMVDARADGLQQKPHRLAADFDETFDAQHVFLFGGGGDTLCQLVRIGDRRDVDDEGVEIVMLVVESA